MATKDEIKAALDAAGVDYPSDANKDELEGIAAEHDVTVTETDDETADADGALEGAQEAADEQTRQGYVGDKVDPRPNEDYSLETGPDSPPHNPGGTSR